MKEYDQSKLFHKEGYIPVKDYIEDIDYMLKNGPWRLPLRFVDYLQFYFLMFIEKFSWFSERLYIVHSSSVSPAYDILLSFLKKKELFDKCYENSVHFRGYFSYYFKKNNVNGIVYKISSQGVSEDQSTAFSKALGELLERFISGVGDMNKNIKEISYNDIVKKFKVFYPPRYHRFLDVQKMKFKVLNYDPSHKIEWVEGVSLITNEKTYIPRQITLWFRQDFEVDHVFINSTTNGSAGYFTKEGAVLRGLLEVVQRDAFLVHWLTMIPPRYIDKNTLPDYIRDKIKEFNNFGITIHILDTTSLQVPSIVVVAINEESEIPQVFVTAGTSINFFEAIVMSLNEMIIGVEMFYYKDKEIESEMNNKQVPFIANIGQVHRQLYWRGRDKVDAFKWFLFGKVVSYRDLTRNDITCKNDDKEKLNICLEILRQKGEDYYPVVYYPKNTIQEELGFHVAQVFIPKAFPLYLSEYFGTFDSDRLQEFAESKSILDWKLNPLPHMFP